MKKHERNNTLLALFEHYQPDNALVFCHTKKQCDEVARFLCEQRIEALAIHGDLDQRNRDQVLVRFANNSCPVLVATDVAARGLDIKSLQAVINYELPRDPEIYVHRIGRTGRAGKKGNCFEHFHRVGTSCVLMRLSSFKKSRAFAMYMNPWIVTRVLPCGRRWSPYRLMRDEKIKSAPVIYWVP